MQGLKRFVWGLPPVLILLVMGCTSRITNLTPTTVPSEKNGLYHFEAEWSSNQRSREIRPEEIKAYLVLGGALYPMERVSRMADRWETEVPVPPSPNPVLYYFKWDYGTAGFGRDVPNSVRSQEYRLEVAEKPKEP